VIDDACAIKQGSEVGVHEVDLFELEVVLAARHLEVLLLQRPLVIVGEAVDPHHLMAGGQQPLAEVRSDEARGPRDDDFQNPRAPTTAVNSV